MTLVAESKLLVYNDDYDGNFDEENYQKTCKCKELWVKIYNFLGLRPRKTYPRVQGAPRGTGV